MFVNAPKTSKANTEKNRIVTIPLAIPPSLTQ
jgi:hypothetical protein